MNADILGLAQVPNMIQTEYKEALWSNALRWKPLYCEQALSKYLLKDYTNRFDTARARTVARKNTSIQDLACHATLVRNWQHEMQSTEKLNTTGMESSHRGNRNEQREALGGKAPGLRTVAHVSEGYISGSQTRLSSTTPLLVMALQLFNCSANDPLAFSLTASADNGPFLSPT